ncbi:MAG: AAA family ATPase, partial [Myxococcales bacterium]|nr:AAA family ATPase [Myxococcales bacterium]
MESLSAAVRPLPVKPDSLLLAVHPLTGAPDAPLVAVRALTATPDALLVPVHPLTAAPDALLAPVHPLTVTADAPSVVVWALDDAWDSASLATHRPVRAAESMSSGGGKPPVGGAALRRRCVDQATGAANPYILANSICLVQCAWMIPRHALHTVQAALNRQAAVALLGPRQVGKTTLALALAEQTGALYLDLEAREDREKLSDPALFLHAYEDRLVILDEIHRVPELFQALRGLIDRGRRHGRRQGRFLVLGSASIDLLRQSGESLAGRIAYVEMGPLDVLEAGNTDAERESLWLR